MLLSSKLVLHLGFGDVVIYQFTLLLMPLRNVKNRIFVLQPNCVAVSGLGIFEIGWLLGHL